MPERGAGSRLREPAGRHGKARADQASDAWTPGQPGAGQSGSAVNRPWRPGTSAGLAWPGCPRRAGAGPSIAGRLKARRGRDKPHGATRRRGVFAIPQGLRLRPLTLHASLFYSFLISHSSIRTLVRQAGASPGSSGTRQAATDGGRGTLSASREWPVDGNLAMAAAMVLCAAGPRREPGLPAIPPGPGWPPPGPDAANGVPVSACARPMSESGPGSISWVFRPIRSGPRRPGF